MFAETGVPIRERMKQKYLNDLRKPGVPEERSARAGTACALGLQSTLLGRLTDAQLADEGMRAMARATVLPEATTISTLSDQLLRPSSDLL